MNHHDQVDDVEPRPVRSSEDAGQESVFTPVAESAHAGDASMGALVDESGILKADASCRHCGYNLRGLPLDAVCPECEWPVARSVFDEQLRFASPAWLYRLSLGVRLILGSMLAFVAITLISIPLILATSGSGVRTQTDFLWMLFDLAGLATIVVWITGVWLLTSPEPGSPPRGPAETARRVARWSTVIALLQLPLTYLVNDLALLTGARTMNALDVMTIILSGVLGLISAVGIGAGFVYLRCLALRIPADQPAREAGIVGWGMLIAIGGLAITSAIMTLAWNSAGTGPVAAWTTVVEHTQIILGIGGLVFGIWTLLLLFRFASQFRRARNQAQEPAHDREPRGAVSG